MRTTIRSSETPSSKTAGNRGTGLRGTHLVAIGGILLIVLGCASAPKTEPGDLLRLPVDSPAHKAMQTRHFETPDSDELLSASAAALQDLGFQVTESVRDLGFLRAAKERSAREYGQEINRGLIAFLTLLLGALGGSNTMLVIPLDLHQQINASLVAQPLDLEGERHELRVVFYRLIWEGDGRSGDTYIPPGRQKMEMIRDPLIYQEFFARLSKAVFLEAHRI